MNCFNIHTRRVAYLHIYKGQIHTNGAHHPARPVSDQCLYYLQFVLTSIPNFRPDSGGGLVSYSYVCQFVLAYRGMGRGCQGGLYELGGPLPLPPTTEFRPPSGTGPLP